MYKVTGLFAFSAVLAAAPFCFDRPDDPSTLKKSDMSNILGAQIINEELTLCGVCVTYVNDTKCVYENNGNNSCDFRGCVSEENTPGMPPSADNPFGIPPILTCGHGRRYMNVTYNEDFLIDTFPLDEIDVADPEICSFQIVCESGFYDITKRCAPAYAFDSFPDGPDGPVVRVVHNGVCIAPNRYNPPDNAPDDYDPDSWPNGCQPCRDGGLDTDSPELDFYVEKTCELCTNPG